MGEDLSYAHRARIQQQEQRMWNEEQIAAKQAAKDAMGDLDSTYAQRAMEIDAIKAQLESTAATGRRAQAVAVAEYQLAQAQRRPLHPPPNPARPPHTPAPHAPPHTPTAHPLHTPHMHQPPQTPRHTLRPSHPCTLHLLSRYAPSTT